MGYLADAHREASEERRRIMTWPLRKLNAREKICRAREEKSTADMIAKYSPLYDAAFKEQ